MHRAHPSKRASRTFRASTLDMKKRTTEGADVFLVKSVAGGYEVFDRRGQRLSHGPQEKADAVIHAKELARPGGAHVLVYAVNGDLESEFFYQEEEREALDRDDSTSSFAASQPAHHHR
jgi:hypothetical protein